MKLKSLFSNIVKIILLFASFTIVIGAFAFFLGESSYGIKNKLVASICAITANVLAGGLMFVLSALLVAVIFRWEYKLKNKLSWKRVLLVTLLSVISGFGLYSFGPLFIIVAFVLILCIIIWKYIRKYKNV